MVVATGGVIFVAQPDFLFGGKEHGPRNPLFYLAIAAALARGFFKAAKFVAVSVTSDATSTHVIVLYLSTMGLTALTIINTYLALRHHGEGVPRREVVGVPTSKVTSFLFVFSTVTIVQQRNNCSAA